MRDSKQAGDTGIASRYLYLSFALLRWNLFVFVFTSLRLFVDFRRDNLDGAASRLDLSACAFRKLMRPNRQCAIHFPFAQHFDEAAPLGGRHQVHRDHFLRCDIGSRLEQFKVGDINNGVVLAEGRIAIAQAAHKGQTLGQARLAAVEGAVEAAATACLLALGAAPGGLAAPGAMTPANAPFRLMRARGWPQIRESHCSISSTSTRWLTLRTIPRIAGLSSCSTVCWSLRSFSARMVAF